VDARAARFFRVFAEVSNAIQSGEGLDTALELMVARIGQAIDAKGCSLRMLDPVSGELRLRAAWGLSASYLEKGPVRAGPGISEVFDDGPIVIRDVSSDPRVQYPGAAAAEGIQAIVSLPFELVGRLRMVLRIYFDHPALLSDDDVRFLDAVAAQGAAAIRCSLLQTRYFDTFRRVMQAIHAGQDVETILTTIVQQVQGVMDAKGAIYWILDADQGVIRHRVSSGFDYESLSGADYFSLVQLFPPDADRPLVIGDARYDSRIPNLERLGKKRVRTVVGIPVSIVAPYTGILAVYFGQQRDLAASEGQFLQALAEQGAVALHKALRYDEEMLNAFRQTVEGLALALEAKDPMTHGHSLKVAYYARRTALALGLPPHQAETVYQAGLLHDIGKIGMQDRILSRLGRLSTSEMDIIRMHPVIGARILSPLTCLQPLVPLVRHHHERFDGRGYPDGLRGDQIPRGARILAACDALDCMLSGRPHMAPVTLERAAAQLEAGAGTHFDPDVIAALAGDIRRHPQIATPLALEDDYLDQFRSRPAPRSPSFLGTTPYPTCF
jgi:putative nucleotidyltransferase with HDIG domain